MASLRTDPNALGASCIRAYSAAVGGRHGAAFLTDAPATGARVTIRRADAVAPENRAIAPTGHCAIRSRRSARVLDARTPHVRGHGAGRSRHALTAALDRRSWAVRRT